MNLVVLSLRDAVAEEFKPPFCVPAIGVAFRSLQDEIQRGGENNIISQHTKDFSLFQIGTWDSDTGVLDVLAVPKLIIPLTELVPVIQ